MPPFYIKSSMILGTKASLYCPVSIRDRLTREGDNPVKLSPSWNPTGKGMVEKVLSDEFCRNRFIAIYFSKRRYEPLRRSTTRYFRCETWV